MGRFWRVVGLVFCAAAYAALLTGLVFFLRLNYAGLLLFLVLAALYAWLVFAFLHYRQCRREEFLLVLAAAAEARAPLAPALWAYLRDRPRGPLREVGTALFLFLVLPGYYWLWHRGSNYDRKVERVAELLEDGCPLSAALRAVPGVASRETLLAATLGEDTGRLAECLQALRNPARARLATLWVEMVPRFGYPLLLLLVINAVLVFWMLYLAPKFERILHDMNVSMPPQTERVLALGTLAFDYSWALGLILPLLAGLLALLLGSPDIRWYFPLVGRLYRGYVCSRILQALSFLLKTGQPAPEALGVLAESGCFVGGARRRLEAVRRRVEQGEPLPESLRRGWILPRSMVPLLRAAERAGNLPWALAELAEVMAGRAARRVQRVGMALSPVPLIGVGVLVGMIVVGVFQPLIAIIEGLSR
jgi:type IV pilus assembly protein PilC